MDTLPARWARLSPHVRAFGPEDGRVRPAVLLFHGCGGLRGHLPGYAGAAAAAGARAFVIDSYAPRGWGPNFARAAVCSGALLRGRERAGDVAAAIWGVSRRADVDPARLALAGWSHGGWAIMEALAAPLQAPGEIGLADAPEADLSGVKAAFLAYPYVGVIATGRMRPWRRCPRTLAVIAEHDHLTTPRNARRVFEAAAACGVEVEVWQAAGTHSFDEPTGFGIMRHDPTLAVESLERFRRLIEEALGPPGRVSRGKRAHGHA